MQQTTVTFPSGSTTETASVVATSSHGDATVVILDTTPFHPVDHTWPDQPGDTGTLTHEGSALGVTDTVMVAFDDAGALAVGADIPVKRGAEGWEWHVGHIVPADATLAAGDSVIAQVDQDRRASLSRGHTACHLASLALDAALADLWRKDPGSDSLGNPNFEARANATSEIRENGSLDTYRLGKSLRKAGFDTESFAATLAERQDRINQTLGDWVVAGGSSWIATEGETIIDRRSWHCALPEREVSFLCGGTHVSDLAAFEAITVELDLTDPQLLVMTTTATPA